ncbi:hypothetical protein ACPUEK_19130 [Marinomonas gallaica]|uniref:hypothetical protein n=1 Tax=Marinomonas gallaica TaxID=1806667 RepID=UPI003CE549F8
MPYELIQKKLSEFSTQSNLELQNLKDLSFENQEKILSKYYKEVYLNNDIFLEISVLFEEHSQKLKSEHPILTKDNFIQYIMHSIYNKIHKNFLNNEDKISAAITSSRECSYVHKKLEKLDSLPVSSLMGIAKTASLNLLIMGILVPLTLLSLELEDTPNLLSAFILGYLVSVASLIFIRVKNLLKSDTHSTHQ